jgi:imidazole glycerol-phosphate synthase subunit HisH
MITIVDYGMGNLGSMRNMFKRIGTEVTIESDPAKLVHASKLVLPGVGSFDAAMGRINDLSGLRDLLTHKANVQKIPILGVCLGMQLLTNSSEEGKLPGLGWIKAKTLRFPHKDGFKVPHMGWNVASPANKSPLTVEVIKEPRYYFVHSFCVHVENAEHSIMRTDYGGVFDSAISRDNIYGVQFHPEKSHRFGMHILKNFAKL